jgi:hypothetical protein
LYLGDVDDRDDHSALSTLLLKVLPDLVCMLATKDCKKTAWDALKTVHMGREHVCKAKAQTRRREFELLRSQSIVEFLLRPTDIVNDLDMLDDPVQEYKAVLKFLYVVPCK